ncbi:MAG: S8/S53 family peptidase, partial [Bacteroidota bacterium]
VVTPTQTYIAITSPDNNGTAREENAEFRLFYQGSNVDFFGSTSPRKELLIDFSGPNGVYKLNIRAVTINNGRFDAIINPSRILLGGESKFLTLVEPGGTIWDLGTSKNNICPNSYILRTQWTDIDGVPRSFIGDDNGAGSLWLGSGIGPTQDGRIGIDISVPGNVNFGAYAEDSFFARFRNNVLPVGPEAYGTLAAVSGANPVLAGVVSLMLEADPTLTAPEIKTILHETARADAFTGSVPNNEWGYGKLDVYAAIRNILGPSVSTNETNVNRAIEIMPNPSNGIFTVSRKGQENTRFQLQIFNLDGKLIKQAIWAAGAPQTAIDLSDFEAGIYYLNGKSSTGFFTKKLIKL